MIADYWSDRFRAQYGGEWPSTYCCVDLESSGFRFGEDVMVEWGHTLVVDGKVKDRLSLVFNWANRQTPPDHWIRTRLDQVRFGMRAALKPCHHSYERMLSEGKSPERAFEFITEFTSELKKKSIPFVLHNGTFDEKMLSANFLQFTDQKGFTFGNLMFDTAAIEKASQLEDNRKAHPQENDNLRTYFTRVNNMRVTGIKSNLDGHCFNKYLKERGVDPAKMHAAEYDSYCCHLMMEVFREQAGERKPQPFYPNADTAAARTPPAAGTPKRIRKVRVS